MVASRVPSMEKSDRCDRPSMSSQPKKLFTDVKAGYASAILAADGKQATSAPVIQGASCSWSASTPFRALLQHNETKKQRCGLFSWKRSSVKRDRLCDFPNWVGRITRTKLCTINVLRRQITAYDFTNCKTASHWRLDTGLPALAQ
jgi:hypothetical protein